MKRNMGRIVTLLLIFALVSSVLNLILVETVYASTKPADDVLPSDIGFSLPSLTPVPVQSVWNIDKDGDGIIDFVDLSDNPDGIIDLVSGKPTAIIVDMAEMLEEIDNPNDQVTINVTMDGQTLTKSVIGSDLAISSLVYLSSAIPYNDDQNITGNYQINSESPVALADTEFNLKSTNDLTLYYGYLHMVDRKGVLTAYGETDQADYDEMVSNTNYFFESAYPVSGLDSDVGYNRIDGNIKVRKDPFEGILKDCIAVAQQAQISKGGSAVGIAIAPDATVTGMDDYFDYHLGYSGPVGVSFGPAVKGVVVTDGFWTAAAHEYAHTLGIHYFPEAEQYLIDEPDGFDANGFWVSENLWISGYDFMGKAAYKSWGYHWTNETTYSRLFEKLLVDPADPEVLLFNIMLYENGAVELPLPFMRLEQGTIDVVPTGNYSIVFLDQGGNQLDEVSFDLTFKAQVDPNVSNRLSLCEIGRDYGLIDIGVAGACFATILPEGTDVVKVKDSTGAILASVDYEEIKTPGNGPDWWWLLVAILVIILVAVVILIIVKVYRWKHRTPASSKPDTRSG